MRLYVEMTKRRNVIVHNAGIINNRYIKEVPLDFPNRLQLNEKVRVDRNYLFGSIKALYALARFYAIKTTHTAYKMGNEVEEREFLMRLEKLFT